MILKTNKNPQEPLIPSTNYEVELINNYNKNYVLYENDYISLTNFLNPAEMLEELIPTANKVIIPIPTTATKVDVLLTNKYLIVYSHKKGNYWNIGGSHWFYLHDINTGNFIGSYNSVADLKILWSCKLLKKDAERLNNLYIKTHS